MTHSNAADSSFNLTFNTRESKIDALERLLANTREAARRRGIVITEDTRHAVGHVLDEAWKNHLLHGNRSDPTLQVTVDAQLEESPDGLQLLVHSRDEGEGFVVKDVPLPSRNDPTGKGVKNMRDYVGRLGGKIAYNQKGNELFMKLPLREPKASAAFADADQGFPENLAA